MPLVFKKSTPRARRAFGTTPGPAGRGLYAARGVLAEDLSGCHPVVEFAGECLWRDPDPVAVARFKYLARVVSVGREPEYGGVGHDVFDDPVPITGRLPDFHPSVDQQAPVTVFTRRCSVQGHVLSVTGLQERQRPDGAAVALVNVVGLWWLLGGDGFFDPVADLALEVFLGRECLEGFGELGLRNDDDPSASPMTTSRGLQTTLPQATGLPTYPGPFFEGPAGTTARAKTARPIAFISSMSRCAEDGRFVGLSRGRGRPMARLSSRCSANAACRRRSGARCGGRTECALRCPG